MKDWQKDFTLFTTSIAFSLSLTRNQCEVLHLIAINGDYQNWKPPGGNNTFVPTVSQLKRRGLVEHNPAVHTTHNWHQTLAWVYRCTPAGEHVHSLLEYSGILFDLGKSNNTTAVYNRVVELFRDFPSEYSVQDVVTITKSDTKAVNNVLDYLYRRERIKRLRRGVYASITMEPPDAID